MTLTLLLTLAPTCFALGWASCRGVDRRREIKAMEARVERLRAEREELWGEEVVGGG